jgi:hypothetical protein
MKKPKKIFWLYIVGIVSLLNSCTFQISSPKPIDATDNTSGPPVNSNGQLVISVAFTEAVDQNTVVPGKTLILKFTKDPNAAVNIAWSADSKNLTITTRKKSFELLTLTPDGGFTLTFIGTDKGNGVVKTKNGATLDGDYDNKAGGDYLKGYIIVG